jgi:ATP-binding cassette subfamily B protein
VQINIRQANTLVTYVFVSMNKKRKEGFNIKRMEKKNLNSVQPKSGLARLLELAATKKPLIAGAGIFSALASIASFVPYIAIYYIIREIVGAYPTFASLDIQKTISFGWLAFGGAIASVLLYFIALMFSHLAAFGTLYELKVNFTAHIAKLPLGFHINFGSGKFRKIMDENIEKIEGFIAHQFPDIVASIVAPIVMLIILFAFDWRFGLAALAGVVLALVLEFKAYGNEGAKKMVDKYQATLEEMNNASVEYIRGISVVKAFKQTVYSFRRLHKTIKAYTGFVIPYTLSWEKYMSGFITIINHIYLLVVPVGIWIGMTTDDYITYALTFIFYLLFVPSISSVMLKILYVSSSMMQISGGVERMDYVLHKKILPETKEPKNSKKCDIEFKNISFAYDENEENPALKNVSFCANQGQITAIVGPSGGGKSTIAHLIPRFYDVSEGGIYIGGVDIRDMKLSVLMEKVSFVFQDVFLFKQSIADNIRIGNENASHEDIVKAAEAAQCHDFIEKLPNGYATVIGTRGVHLSGGERQRLAIARAIVKDSPIIVLDEATAFADPENEHLIQKAFEKLMHNKTVIIIAHRLSSIRSADKIIVMEQGCLVEEGTHEQLIESKGRYCSLWEIFSTSLNWKMAAERRMADV